jgi:hypothetical protein
LDDKPFIVMPYLKNGNVRDYVQSHPDCDLLRIVNTFISRLRMSDQYIAGPSHFAGPRVPSLAEGCSWRSQSCNYF